MRGSRKTGDLMAIPAVLLKRLETLERSCNLDGRNAIKVFIFHPGETIPYWDPESPEAWQQAHLKGHAIILEVRDYGVHNDHSSAKKQITSS